MIVSTAFIVFLVLFLVLFVIGMPVGFAMVTASISYVLIGGIDMAFFSQQSFKALFNVTLTCIPMFMLTAEIMNRSTVADRMYNFANSLVGWIPGGLGHTNVLTSVIFAGMSGSAAADTSGIGYLSYKAMKDRGFDGPFSAAVTAASSCIGPIIPPSIPVVIYAMTVTSASVGSMLVAGVVPGVIMALSMMIYIYFVSKKRNYPVEVKPSLKEFGIALKRGFLPVMTPVVLLLTIVSGVVTVSEGAVITVIYTCILGVILYRAIGIKEFIASLKEVAKLMGNILLFLVVMQLFSYVIARENIISVVSGYMQSLSLTQFQTMLVINLFFLIAGCFFDTIINIMLFAPLAWSIIRPFGMDPNVFGIILVFNCVVGTITPPVGSMAYLIAGITKEPLEKVFKEILPFVLGYILVLIFMSAFPGIIGFLPQLLMG